MAAKRSAKNPKTAHPLLARPLDSLIFLLPLIVFYEAATLFIDPDGIAIARDRVIAFQLLQIFFEMFGVSGVLFPGLAVIAILLATHVASRQRWRINTRGVAFMYFESLLWALPLVALSQFTNMSAVESAAETWVANVALCVGAGIYEELIFRLALIGLIVIVGADLLRFPHDSTLVVAVLVAALVFALHHHPPFGGEPFDSFRFAFRSVAGVYLGAIFLLRGYGPAAGAHIGYNLIVIAMVP